MKGIRKTLYELTQNNINQYYFGCIDVTLSSCLRVNLYSITQTNNRLIIRYNKEYVDNHRNNYSDLEHLVEIATKNLYIC